MRLPSPLYIKVTGKQPLSPCRAMYIYSCNVHASKSDPDRPFPSHLTCSVHTEQKTDERSTRIDKNYMEIDQNDRDPPNSISKLSKAIDNVHASKSDPDTKTVLKPNKKSGRGT